MLENQIYLVLKGIKILINFYKILFDKKTKNLIHYLIKSLFFTEKYFYGFYPFNTKLKNVINYLNKLIILSKKSIPLIWWEK